MNVWMLMSGSMAMGSRVIKVETLADLSSLLKPSWLRDEVAARLKNQPKIANQMPARRLPVMKEKTPKKINANPNAVPTAVAMRVAHAKSFFHHHKSERKTRPPSKGNAGIRLKATMSRLMSAR